MGVGESERRRRRLEKESKESVEEGRKRGEKKEEVMTRWGEI